MAVSGPVGFLRLSASFWLLWLFFCFLFFSSLLFSGVARTLTLGKPSSGLGKPARRLSLDSAFSLLSLLLLFVLLSSFSLLLFSSCLLLFSSSPLPSSLLCSLPSPSTPPPPHSTLSAHTMSREEPPIDQEEIQRALVDLAGLEKEFELVDVDIRTCPRLPPPRLFCSPTNGERMLQSAKRRCAKRPSSPAATPLPRRSATSGPSRSSRRPPRSPSTSTSRPKTRTSSAAPCAASTSRGPTWPPSRAPC